MDKIDDATTYGLKEDNFYVVHEKNKWVDMYPDQDTSFYYQCPNCYYIEDNPSPPLICPSCGQLLTE